MAKILNLNTLSAKETREVQIGTVTYVIKEMSVEDFIETTRVAEEMENETSYGKQLQATVALIKRAIPDVEEKTLYALSLGQLRGLTSFIRGEDPEKIVSENAVDGEQSGN